MIFISKKKNRTIGIWHSLRDQIGRQLDAGFTITAMLEDTWDVENKMDEFSPSFIATKAVK